MKRTTPCKIAVMLPALSLLCSSSFPVAADPLNEWTWRCPTPTGNRLRGIAFGDNLYVAVGDYGTIMTSSDGSHWAQQPSGSKEHLSELTYGNGVFVAAAPTYDFPTGIWTNPIFTSPDGAHWTRRFIGITNELGNVTFANGLFFAIARFFDAVKGQWYTEMFTSSDGVTWPDHRTALLRGEVFDVAFGNGTFVAVSAEGVVWTSADSVNWSRRDIGFSKAYLRGVTFGRGIFVTVGGNRLETMGEPLAAAIWTSTDGITWMERKRDDVANGGFFRVRYGNGEFVALGGSGVPTPLWTSPDGATWTVRTGPGQLLGGFAALSDAAWGIDRFVIVGDRGMILTSKDGASWATLPDRDQGAVEAFTSICHGNGTYVATAARLDSKDGSSSTNVILTSLDAATWIPRLDVRAEGGEPLAVKFLNGIFIAFGGDGILTSSDGLTWAKRFSNWRAEHVAYGNGIFSAVFSGYVSTSVDGTAWSSPERSAIENDMADTWLGLECLTFGNGRFVAAGRRSVPGQQDVISGIWTSTNSLSWIQRYGEASFNPLPSDAAYGDGTFVVVTQGSTLTSSDGLTWAKREGPGFRRVVFANGAFVAVANRGAFRSSGGDIQTSWDGIVWASRLTVSPSLFDVAYGKGTFVAVGYGAVLQSARIGPRLVANGVSAADSFQLKLLGEAGQNYQMEASSDLVNWLPFRTTIATGFTLEFEDTDVSNFPRRFYRALLRP